MPTTRARALKYRNARPWHDQRPHHSTYLFAPLPSPPVIVRIACLFSIICYLHMGVVESVIAVATDLIGAVVGLIEGLRSDSSSGSIARNPVTEELEERIREEQRKREQAEAEKWRAEEEKRQAEEQRRKAENEAREREAERRRAEEAQHRAEEDARRAEEEKRRAEEARQWAETQQRDAEERRRQTEEEARKTEEECNNAEEGQRRAEHEKWLADEARRKAEEDTRRAEEGQRKAEEEKRCAEEERRNAEEERKRAEEARAAADKVAQEAREQLEEVQRNVRKGIKPVLIPTMEEYNATKKRLQYQEGLFHFAVAGIAGSGKSSLINAFRGLRNKHRGAGAAPTGVTETTSVITRYPDPDSRNPFVWYDVPGAGTLKIPDFVYFNAQGLYVFDCIIVLFDARFTDTDIAILRNCERFNIPAYIVRSKSLQHIRNVMEDLEWDDEEEEDETLDDEEVEGKTLGSEAAKWARAREQYDLETRKSVLRNLEQAKLPPQRVYLVDKETMAQVIKGRQPPKAIDEWILLRDLLAEARLRRSRSVVARG
ncbi:uncharacterized protein LAESUDRAFT_816722 [Laetiporus sulphureus 93-53]|uniref:IRG-type G domain-containing protein n=1 Tax=Laetiporus sulphureus 93-53 TaxID=1314785 RepID=A0A165B1D5_9APHY|nr:uncharacterized protein LAESUDRAFT_816722 [Laetiporus sulphureus 93-53]KZT00046.1 hypothetical protein LAESUDRAFT_816722 [Laetiporus sulphureus 93-53]